MKYYNSVSFPKVLNKEQKSRDSTAVVIGCIFRVKLLVVILRKIRKLVLMLALNSNY